MRRYVSLSRTHTRTLCSSSALLQNTHTQTHARPTHACIFAPKVCQGRETKAARKPLKGCVEPLTDLEIGIDVSSCDPQNVPLGMKAYERGIAVVARAHKASFLTNFETSTHRLSKPISEVMIREKLHWSALKN